MPYDYTTTISKQGGQLVVVIEETGCGNGDEAVIENLPSLGSVIRQICTLSSGSAMVVHPVLYIDQGDPAGRVVCENDYPRDEVDNGGRAATYFLENRGSTLYHQSRPNAGQDNVIRTEYHFSTSWSG